MTATQEPFAQWAIIELMGHRRLGGLVTEVERFGTKMARVDIPPSEEGGQTITQFYGGSSIYALTITDEETARAVARARQQQPVEPWSARRMLEIEDRVDGCAAELELEETDDDGSFLG